MNLRRRLEERLSVALRDAAGVEGLPAMVVPSTRPQFGDYQANGVMAAAKKLKRNPRELADRVARRAQADLAELAERVEVAGPGFINVHLRREWLAGRLAELLGDERLGAEVPEHRQTVVVDYSSPNLAKEMHVGHLRSTIIGDALVRLLEFLGHKVIRQNHVGDWGTQFGMVILGLWHICMARHRGQPGYISRELERLSALSPGDEPARRTEALRPICQRHQEDLDADPDGQKVFYPYLRALLHSRELTLDDLLPAYRFVNRVETLAEGTELTVNSPPDRRPIPLSGVSRYITTMLQDRGDPRNRQEGLAWRYAREMSLEACEEIYRRLGVLLSREDIRGESDYHSQLPEVVNELASAGLLRESEGAKCVFLEQFKNKDGQPLPVIVQKSDGGYLYATTDLAAMCYRVRHLHADRILYVIDSRQTLHLQQVFAVARAAGFAPPEVALEHVAFGTMQGADGRPFRTRDGQTMKLAWLLDEAERRAFELVSQKSPALPVEQRRQIARVVGIGAVKYADLVQNRMSDYIFSFEKMLALDGNTAPYMQYAYARIRSIFRKGGPGTGDLSGIEFGLGEPAERALAVKLLQFPETLQAVADDCLPHLLCGYLYELAVTFTGFYESCPVLKSDEPKRSARLALCDLTARTIRTGLNLLGIETVEQM
ncbi:MAG: arginine--tRNA ligase [Planctomycetales bacterium 4484_123]|nr:MAG: arginine--tRNA ligase [Planctomycetales bacterium 4484_123]